MIKYENNATQTVSHALSLHSKALQQNVVSEDGNPLSSDVSEPLFQCPSGNFVIFIPKYFYLILCFGL